jgi:hypothetical protein
MPEYQASGLRIGSPAPTDAGWLKQFIGHCDDMAYRCDFVAFHSYWGTNEAPNAESWRSQLKSIYDNTKRPIWITEWNNGASWTTESWPESYGDKLSKQRDAIRNILKVLDESDFIERYSVYNWDSYYRAMVSWDSDKGNWWVTPAGEVYRDAHPSHAYQEKMQFVPRGWFPSMNTDNEFSFSLKAAGRKFTSVVTNKNGDFTKEEMYEYRKEDGSFAPFCLFTKRSKLDSTSKRSTSMSCDDCAPEAFATDSLTLRMKITTLAGGVTYTDPVTVAIPEFLQNYYTGISGALADETVIASGDGCVTIRTTKPVQVRVYRMDGSLVATQAVDSEIAIPVPNGMYLVNGVKVVVK